MNKNRLPRAVAAQEVPPRTKSSNYPEPFFSRMAKREKKPLGDFFSLRNFGVNLTTLAPGGESALIHSHSRQDELIYILQGNPTLVTESGETVLEPGMCAGFAAQGEAHHVFNNTDRDVVMLEIGDRSEGDEVRYPEDDLQAVLESDGKWRFTRKSGSP